MEDVSMELPADKRSRESPDSTLKPEGKSLKTSGVATATSAYLLVLVRAQQSLLQPMKAMMMSQSPNYSLEG